MAHGHHGGKHILKLKKFLPPGASVLEIGSGPGTDWKILNKNYRVTVQINLPNSSFETLLIQYYLEFEKDDSILYIGKKSRRGSY